MNYDGNEDEDFKYNDDPEIKRYQEMAEALTGKTIPELEKQAKEDYEGTQVLALEYVKWYNENKAEVNRTARSKVLEAFVREQTRVIMMHPHNPQQLMSAILSIWIMGMWSERTGKLVDVSNVAIEKLLSDVDFGESEA
jgi:predicted metalloprotease